MPHLLGRIRGPPPAVFKAKLREDEALHRKDGIHLEHVWTNADDPAEIVFLMRAHDMTHARQTIERRHAEARKADPKANLPSFTYLE